MRKKRHNSSSLSFNESPSKKKINSEKKINASKKRFKKGETSKWMDDLYKRESDFYQSTNPLLLDEISKLNKKLTNPQTRFFCLKSLEEMVSCCHDDLFSVHFNHWFSSTLQILTSSETIAAYEVLKKLVARETNEGVKQLTPLIPLLFHKSQSSESFGDEVKGLKEKLIISKMDCIEVFLIHHSSFSSQYKGKIEKYLFQLSKINSIEIRKKVAILLARLTGVGGANVQFLRDNWLKLMNCSLDQANDVLLPRLLETGKPPSIPSSFFPLLENSLLSNHSYLLHSFSLFIEIIQALLSISFPTYVEVPLEKILNFVTSVLDHRLILGRVNLKGGEGTLLKLHLLIFRLLQNLVTCCHDDFHSWVGLIFDCLIQSLVDFKRKELNQAIPYCSLRFECYQLLLLLFSFSLLPRSLSLLRDLLDLVLYDLSKVDLYLSNQQKGDKFIAAVKETFNKTKNKMASVSSSSTVTFFDFSPFSLKQEFKLFVLIVKVLASLTTCNLTSIIEQPSSSSSSSFSLPSSSSLHPSSSSSSSISTSSFLPFSPFNPLRLKNHNKIPIDIIFMPILKKCIFLLEQIQNNNNNNILTTSNNYHLKPEVDDFFFSLFTLLSSLISLPHLRDSSLFPSSLSLIQNNFFGSSLWLNPITNLTLSFHSNNNLNLLLHSLKYKSSSLSFSSSFPPSSSINSPPSLPSSSLPSFSLPSSFPSSPLPSSSFPSSSFPSSSFPSSFPSSSFPSSSFPSSSFPSSSFPSSSFPSSSFPSSFSSSSFPSSSFLSSIPSSFISSSSISSISFFSPSPLPSTSSSHFPPSSLLSEETQNKNSYNLFINNKTKINNNNKNDNNNDNNKNNDNINNKNTKNSTISNIVNKDNLIDIDNKNNYKKDENNEKINENKINEGDLSVESEKFISSNYRSPSSTASEEIQNKESNENQDLFIIDESKENSSLMKNIEKKYDKSSENKNEESIEDLKLMMDSFVDAEPES